MTNIVNLPSIREKSKEERREVLLEGVENILKNDASGFIHINFDPDSESPRVYFAGTIYYPEAVAYLEALKSVFNQQMVTAMFNEDTVLVSDVVDEDDED